MSNELLTPIVLQVDAHHDQQEAVFALLYARNLAHVTDRALLNTEAETISIEMIRELIESLSYASQGKRVVALLHAEKLSLPAQQAMLKTLEEPPANTLIILATAQPQALLPTILSRCVLRRSEEQGNGEVKLELSEQFQKLLTEPESMSLSECIDLAEAHKDRGEAIELINQGINWLGKQKKVPHQMTALLACLDALQKNASVQLALEHCFFKLKQSNF